MHLKVEPNSVGCEASGLLIFFHQPYLVVALAHSREWLQLYGFGDDGEASLVELK